MSTEDAKCANCAQPALYRYEMTAAASQLFCNLHLPAFLRKQGAPIALVQTTEHHAAARASASAKLAPKKAATKSSKTKITSEESLMVDAPLVDVGDTDTSNKDESEVTQTDGPED
jgi:hypothetical protein